MSKDVSQHWKNVLVNVNTSILTAIKRMDAEALRVLLVVNDAQQLLGIITDGDIRRYFLKQASLENNVSAIMSQHPVTASLSETRDQLLIKMQSLGILHLPIVDHEQRVIGLETLENLVAKKNKDNWVVLMAGGLGTRLKPLTDNCPKPLLKIGSKPVLEIVLENFIEHGFNQFYFAINYKGHLIRDYFGDGSQWGITIRYLEEKERLGTAGALSLLPEKPRMPIFVMNADLMTKVNFEQLLQFHQEHQASATICVREYKQVIPYGVVHISKENYQLIDIKEKPEHNLFVNAGIYVLNSDVLDHVPNNGYLDMPDLLTTLIKKNQFVSTFPIREYWLDIGRMEDLQQAHQDYDEVFA
jgi:dTDP-glucose pyrophosphorylase/predicted transcriptional regulator